MIMDKLFEDNKVYTPKEIAETLRITKEAVYYYIKTGRLKAKRVGKSWRILGKDINEFIEVEN